MDGTLINTEPFWRVAQRDLAAAYDAPWTEDDAHEMAGKPLPDSAALFRSRGVEMSIRQVIDNLSERVVAQLGGDLLPWMRGALALLADIDAAGIPVALVTNAFSGLAKKVAAAVPGTPFVTVVAGDDVSEGKPSPEPYQLAMSRLGVDPAHCVALEDTATGTFAAEAAGIRPLVIPGWRGIDAAPGRSRVRSLEGVTLADLEEIAGGKTIDHLG